MASFPGRSRQVFQHWMRGIVKATFVYGCRTKLEKADAQSVATRSLFSFNEPVCHERAQQSMNRTLRQADPVRYLPQARVLFIGRKTLQQAQYPMRCLNKVLHPS